MVIFANACDQAELGPYFRSTKSKLLLIVSVVAVALLNAAPAPWVERAVLELGQDLCDAASGGARRTPARVVFMGPWATEMLRNARRHLQDDCEIELRIGESPPENWSDKWDDYLLLLRSNGTFVIGFEVGLPSAWSLPLPIEEGRYAGRFRIRPVWPEAYRYESSSPSK